MTVLLKLKTDAWRTSGARYNAARRLRRRSIFSTASLAFFSASTVVLALIQVTSVANNAALGRYLTVLSGCLGVFLLAISLIEWGARSSERADNLHRNAELLNGFYRQLDVILSSGVQGSTESVLKEQERYGAIKATCFDNHEPIDDALFVARHRGSDEFLDRKGCPRYGLAKASWIAFRHYWSSIWYFCLCWIVFLLLIANAPWGQGQQCDILNGSDRGLRQSQ